MQNRAVKIIRWILFVPLTLTISALAWTFLSGGQHGALYARHSIWWSIVGLAPSWSRLFITFFLIGPVITLLVPEKKKTILIIALVLGVVAGLSWFAPHMSLYGEFESMHVFEWSDLCGRMAGLFSGGWIAFRALRQSREGKPFFKKTTIACAAILCVAAIPIVFERKAESSFDFHDFKSDEDHGVVSFSFGLENKTDKRHDLIINVMAERWPDRMRRSNVVELGKTQIMLTLMPLERKDATGQILINGPTTGYLVVYPQIIPSTLAKTDFLK
jgi:hypothetical protein